MIISFIKYLTFTFYLRFFLQVYLLFSLASIAEIEKFNTDNGTRTRSLITAFVVILFCALLLIISFIHWLKYGFLEELDESKMVNLYSGLRPTRWARLFNIFFMSRRLLLSILLILLFDADKVIKIIILASIQLIYCVTITIIRPFNTKKDNMLEIINEIGYSVIAVVLIYFHKESNWETVFEWIIWTLIIAILGTFLIISISKF